MGLISTEVEVSIGVRNIRHYENLGYVIPKHKDKKGKDKITIGAKITVMTKDLPKNSKTVVDVKCDGCGKDMKVLYSAYNKINKDGIYYCVKCAGKFLRSGENNGSWKSDKTQKEREDDRSYPEYRDFIKKVMARDEYKCIVCGAGNEANLQVHHLDGYDWCKDKRTLESNGVTLCKQHHLNFHSIYHKGNNTREQFEEWFKDFKQKEDYKGEVYSTRQVYLYEDDIIFNSAEDCAKYINTSKKNIYSVCNKKIHITKITNKSGKEKEYKGRSLTTKGKHVFWLDEYEKMSKEEIQKIIMERNKRCKKVICLNTLKVYETITSIANDYPNIQRVCITRNCKGEGRYAGIDPVTKEPLRWMYYEDYINQQENKKEV